MKLSVLPKTQKGKWAVGITFICAVLIIISILSVFLLSVVGDIKAFYISPAIVLGVAAALLTVLIFGLPAFLLGKRRYKKKPTHLSLGLGIFYTLTLPLLFLILSLLFPALFVTVIFPPVQWVVCIFLFWQLGKSITGIRDLHSKNEDIPTYSLCLVIVLITETFLYTSGISLFYIVLFAI